ncbi:MAG: hypothetical protein E6J79_03330 [Deltaproteobacteria bacterium]|nr:MAG: hypothetical protein E6J79_03330 [Deltaproteobacteria bacterium]
MRVLGIDVGERELRVARAVRTFGAVRLGAVERIPFADRGELAGALAQLAAWRPQAVFTALPAALATHRIFTLPFRDRRRLAATAPLELLGQLPVAPEDPVIAFEALARTEAGATVLAAVARRTDVEACVEPLVAADLAPARLDLAPLPAWGLVPDTAGDTALVLADGARSALSLRRDGRIVALRALGAPATEPAALAAEVRWNLAALGGAPPTIAAAGPDAVPVAAALGAVPLRELAATTADTEACAVAVGLVAGGRHGVAFDVGPGARGTSLRPIAALALLALVLGVVDLGIVRHDLSHRDAALRAAIEHAASEALPGARLVAPQAQLEAAVASALRQRTRLGDGTGVLEVLRELSTRVTVGLDLDQLTIDADAVDLRGRAASFETVETLRRTLADAPFLTEVTADETRATVDGRGVEFRLRAVRRPAGASS